jgi:hypothetical protein
LPRCPAPSRPCTPGRTVFVLKPFGVEDFAQAVQETLQQRSGEQERLRLRVQLPILEIAQALLSEGDLALLAQQLLEPVVRELAAEQAALLAFDPETDVLSVVGSLGRPAVPAEMRISVSPAFLEQLRQSADPIVVEPRNWMQQFLPAALDTTSARSPACRCARSSAFSARSAWGGAGPRPPLPQAS